MSPYRSKLPAGRDGFAQLVHAELTKFRTVRAWVVLLGVTAALIVGLASVAAPHSGVCLSRPGAPPACSTPTFPHVPTGPGGGLVVDTFTFVHRPMVGNGTLTVEVTSLTGTRPAPGPGAGALSPTQAGPVPWAKAGLILTAKTTQGSAYAAVLVTGSHGVQMQYDYTHSIPGARGAVTAASPRWLRLSRSGDVVTAYDSSDGSHWTEIKEVRLSSLPSRVQVGLFVTSPETFSTGHNNGSATLATASFSRVDLAGGFPRRGWSDQVVGAHPGSYFTVPTGSNWFREAGGTFTISGSGDIAPQVSGNALQGMGDTTSLLAGGTFGLIAVIVLAALSVTSEYRRGLIRTTFTASPHRGRVLAAKGVVVGSAAFVAASVGTAVAEGVSRHVLAVNGSYVFPLGIPAEVRVILGTGLLFALAAVGVLSLATVLRRSAGAVVAGIVLFLLPLILMQPLTSGSDWLLRVTPAAAFAIQGTLPRFSQVGGGYTISNGYYPIGPWVGLAVLCAYAAAAFAAAVWSLRRRDA